MRATPGVRVRQGFAVETPGAAAVRDPASIPIEINSFNRLACLQELLAALDGRVVYAGSGLRGYGNLVILKHNNTYLSAYAHNQTLLVKEDQNVRKGQKIAEMGSSDSDRTKLHFEIRRLGKPVDPAKYLPSR